MTIFKPHKYIKHPNVASPSLTPWPTIRALCTNYKWPVGLLGGGVIGIIECGGGWIASDVNTSCRANSVRNPVITDVNMDLTNSFGTSDADDEVALDIQVATASYTVATGRTAQIRMYWTTDIAAGITQAAADGCDVCSISWGADEAAWGLAGATALNTAAAAAVEKGMLIFAASGDNDSSDGGTGATNVDCPASCPSVIGCGGTSKTTTTEVVWNNNPGSTDGQGTGGGYSTFFTPMPSWQVGAPAAPAGKGRMVPDMSANADPYTGVYVWVDGQQIVVGGTSMVAPLYAGLFGSFGKKLGNGMIQKLYLNQSCFHDITSGNNGYYNANIGPDPCTGIGSPLGQKLLYLIDHIS